MVVIQNIINDATVEEEKLKLTCQQFMQEFDVGNSELVVSSCISCRDSGS